MANDIYLSYNVIFLKLIGILSLESKNGIIICLFWCWRFIQNLVFLYLIIGAFINFRQSTELILQVQSITYFETINIIGIGICYFCRINYFIMSEKKWLNLISEMQIIFKWETSTGLEEKSLEKHVKLIKRFTIVSVVVLTTTSQGTILLPFLLNKTSERIFPTPLWFPDYWKISPYYELALFYQIYVTQAFVAVMVGVDVFFAAAIILTCCQFDMLGWECKCLLHKASKKLPKNIEELITEKKNFPRTMAQDNELYLVNEALTKQIEEDLLKDLRKLVVFHQSLLNFCDRFNAFFSPMLLWYILIILIITVFILFVIVMTKINDLNLLMVSILYLVTGTTFVFLPCFFGQLLTNQSEKLFEDLYDSPWYMCNENLKRTFKLLQLRAYKPIVLTIGTFGILSLNAFLVCMKSVVSYVIALHQISEKNQAE